MAWTTLPTQSAGQVASASGWANIVKANLESLGPVMRLLKTSDQANSGARTPITGIELPVLANEKWFAIWQVLVTGGGTPQYGFSQPTGCEIAPLGTHSAGVFGWGLVTATSSSSTGLGGQTHVTTTVNVGGTAGNVALEFAPSSGTATAEGNHCSLYAVRFA